MKKNILLCAVFFLNAQLMSAQTPLKLGDRHGAIKDALDNYLCEIFEFPNYQGRSIKLYENTQLNSFPFPLSFWHYSMKVKGNAADYTIRLKSCDGEFPTYVYARMSGGSDFFISAPSNSIYNTVPLPNICELSVEKTARITVTLNGIETDIHNNDCKKMYGDISMKIQETTDGNPITIRKITDLESSSETVTYYFARRGSLNLSMGDENIFFQQRADLHITSVPTKRLARRPLLTATYLTTEKALRDNKVLITVMTDLSSAHKNSDLDPFFTWDIKMKKQEKTHVYLQNLPIHANSSLGRELIAGPYTAYGATPGTADGGYNNPHIIKVHFSVNY